MNITIIGAGNVGGALGGAWREAGHEIVYGTRDPSADKLEPLLGDGASAATVREAIADADVVVLATPWHATEAILMQTGGLVGKVVIDCTNPLNRSDAGIELALGFDRSGGELVQSWVPDARVVKAFNSTGFHNMADADFQDGKPVMFYCGNDADAKQVCHELIDEIGFEAIDAGGIEVSRLLEPYAMLWIHLAANQGLGRHFAYALVRRTPGQ